MVFLICFLIGTSLAFVPEGLMELDFAVWGSFSEKEELNTYEELVPHTSDKGIDVLSQQLFLDCLIPSDSIVGYNRLQIAFTSPATDTILLDLSGALNVDSVKATFSPVFWHRRENGICINRPPTSVDTVSVTVFYSGLPEAGYYSSENIHENDVWFTLSEPVDSRMWYPCNDWPWDKFTSRVSVRVPDGYSVLSNGTLRGVDSLDDGHTTWHWLEENPIASYLVSLAIHPYTIIGGIDSLVAFWAYPEDVDSITYDWGRTQEMINLYSDLFVPYPFAKYHQSEIPHNGAMEHQTCTSMGDRLVDGVRTWEWVVAHELSHQWFGDLVTCHTWMDLWLNEGFATFSESLWMEHLYGEHSYRNYLGYLKRRYIGHLRGGYEDRFSIYDPEYMWGVTVYHKAGAVLGMLRDKIGDELFFGGVQAYLERYAFRSATTEEFKEAMEEYSGMDLNLFFHQWIYSAGHPVLDLTWEVTPESFNIDIEQIQPETTVFIFDLEVDLIADGDTLSMTFPISGRTHHFTWDSEDLYALDAVIDIDPDDRVIVEVLSEERIDEVDIPAENSLSFCPNPFNSALRISSSASEIEIYDVRGKHVQTLTGGTSVWNAEGCPSGLYLVRAQKGDDVVEKRVVLIR